MSRSSLIALTGVTQPWRSGDDVSLRSVPVVRRLEAMDGIAQK